MRERWCRQRASPGFWRCSAATQWSSPSKHSFSTPDSALGSLEALAPSQGDSYDDRHDQQPGKIEHEYRRGELAHFDQIPQTPYYGTHDTTALYVWAAAALWRWTGKRDVHGQTPPARGASPCVDRP